MHWFSLEPVDQSFFDDPDRKHAQHRITATSPAPPETVWAELHGARPLHWCSGIRSCTWDPGSPNGVGSKRTVALAPGVRVKERYFMWEENSETWVNAFSVEASTAPGLRHFGERYRVERTDSGSLFHWDFYIEYAPKVLQVLTRPATRATINRLARDTQQYFADLPAAGGPQ